MLRREIQNGEMIDFRIDGEVRYESVDGMASIVPYSSQWDQIIVQISGGLDSALMLYLVAKTFDEAGVSTQIRPLSLEVPTKAKSLDSARKVISFIKDFTGYQNILPALEYEIPIHSSRPPMKDRFFTELITDLLKNKGYQFDFNGNTKNPPPEVRQDFEDDESRERTRDDRKSIYNTPHSASPHALNNKKGIVHLYQRYNLLEGLAPLTLSCDMNLEDIKARDLPIPCGVCWWCRERAWGFEANGLVPR